MKTSTLFIFEMDKYIPVNFKKIKMSIENTVILQA